MHPHFDILPAAGGFPALYSRLVDGRVSPASVVLGGGPHGGADDDDVDPTASARLLLDLDTLDATCHPYAQRAASAVVASMSFLTTFASATPTRRARLLDGSSSRGPFSFWRRVPIVPEAREVDTSRHLFGFRHPDDFRAALSVRRPPPHAVRRWGRCPRLLHPVLRRAAPFDFRGRRH